MEDSTGENLGLEFEPKFNLCLRPDFEQKFTLGLGLEFEQKVTLGLGLEIVRHSSCGSSAQETEASRLYPLIYLYCGSRVSNNGRPKSWQCCYCGG